MFSQSSSRLIFLRLFDLPAAVRLYQQHVALEFISGEISEMIALMYYFSFVGFVNSISVMNDKTR